MYKKGLGYSMDKVNKFEITKIQKYILIYMYFFPVVFLSFTSLYLLVNGHDPKGFFLTNVLISQTVILIPLILSVCMLVTKKLYKEKDQAYEYASIGLGILSFLFMVGCNYYQYYKYAAVSISIDLLRVAFITSFLLACFVSSIFFIKKYLGYVNDKKINGNKKISNMLIAGSFPLILALSSYFIN